jgi:hypothetical protein
MAQQLFFSRDTKMYLEFNGTVWELPVLDGFSFSQATNSSEITLNEMESAGGVSRRGRRMFNDSLAPAEWSFSTYVRPFTSAGSGAEAADTSAKVHAVEEVLWAAMAGADTYNAGVYKRGTENVLTPAASTMAVSFEQSNKSTMGTFNVYFVLGNDNEKVYKLKDAVVAEASVDFDIDGIATIGWSGNASEILDLTTNNSFNQASAPVNAEGLEVGDVWLDSDDSNKLYVCTNSTAGSEAFTPRISEAITNTGNFIRNRLTTLTVAPTPGSEGSGSLESSYLLTLTGGSVSFSNNITFITPEELGLVNTPIGHVTGTRSISGSFTCYLSKDDTSDDNSADLWEDLKGITGVVTNSFGLTFNIGGTSGTGLAITMPTCHIDIPTHSIEDVISLETTFNALPSTIGGADEVSLTYRP